MDEKLVYTHINHVKPSLVTPGLLELTRPFTRSPSIAGTLLARVFLSASLTPRGYATGVAQ